jgi:hypothetical protein
MDEAADEIERQRQLITQLVDELRAVTSLCKFDSYLKACVVGASTIALIEEAISKAEGTDN